MYNVSINIIYHIPCIIYIIIQVIGSTQIVEIFHSIFQTFVKKPFFDFCIFLLTVNS